MSLLINTLASVAAGTVLATVAFAFRCPTEVCFGGKAYFELAIEWRLWCGLRSFPRRPL
jgi:hypothetical protein